ncbi:hypothetical protein NG798_05940 [Ancylothrix sp. C2]|uniref:hypothetical protein n=1 Tax=Ancylothrix sp. D3o TaxID=2953691 RepID=UPI0021BB2F61|nr:hypothetical protein [Ancylothrix sp. D3o]MCT7949322.1 hypothetical protein [Ancylothrix sp. D3o]
MGTVGGIGASGAVGGNKNACSGFDVFRNWEFNPEQVMDYIRRWLAPMGDAATGESLEAALAQSENSRLKEFKL